jgi:hypothetical protein
MPLESQNVAAERSITISASDSAIASVPVTRPRHPPDPSRPYTLRPIGPVTADRWGSVDRSWLRVIGMNFSVDAQPWPAAEPKPAAGLTQSDLQPGHLWHRDVMTMSGRCSRVSSIASTPSPASAATARSGSLSRISRNPRRTNA